LSFDDEGEMTGGWSFDGARFGGMEGANELLEFGDERLIGSPEAVYPDLEEIRGGNDVPPPDP
jgi:hypothetical protein